MIPPRANNGLDRFAGRTAGVATCHGKEKAISPALMAKLPIAGVVGIDGVDTDRFGAFSGEVRRVLDPLEACKAKARLGAEVSGMDLVIASEGSFGPYPPAPFIPCDEEVIVMLDLRDGLCFVHRHVSLQAVFGGQSCGHIAEVMDFAERMRFPEHALVLRAKERWEPGDGLWKGIADERVLREQAARIIAAEGACWIETDMRAMMNPTRMQVIAETARGLAQEIATLCPDCGACWFRITGTAQGLPCALCGYPTAAVRYMERACWQCGRQERHPRIDGKQVEDPMHCPSCNP